MMMNQIKKIMKSEQRTNKMKNKFLWKVVLLLILTTPKLLADITQAQFDEYMKVSRANLVLKYYETKLFLNFENTLNIDIKNKKDLKNRSTKEFKEIFISLDKQVYNDIMKFYNTKEGIEILKITAAFPSFYNKQTELKKIKKLCKNITTEDCYKYIELEDWEKFSENSKKLLNRVANEFDVINIKRDFMKQSLLSMNLIYKKEYQYSNDFIKAYSTFNDLEYNKTTSKISYLFFKDFTEDELKKIVDYALSDAGQQEYKLIEEGITAYTNEFIKRVLMLYYPDKCNVNTDKRTPPKKNE